MDQAEAISLRAPSRQSMQAAAVHSHCCSLAPQDFPAGCQAVQQPVPTLQGAAAWAQQCHTVTHRLAGPLGAPASSTHTEHGRHLQLLTSRHCPSGSKNPWILSKDHCAYSPSQQAASRARSYHSTHFT